MTINDFSIKSMQYRRRNNLSQAQFAQKLNTHTSFVTRIEKGGAVVNQINSFKLQKLFNNNNNLKEDAEISLAKQLRLKRLAEGLTYSQLAEKINVSKRFLCDIEQNNRNISLKTRGKLSSYLNKDLASSLFKVEKKWGDKLYNLRISKYLTIRDLSIVTKIHHQTLLVAERSQNISVSSIKKLAVFFNVSIDYFFQM